MRTFRIKELSWKRTSICEDVSQYMAVTPFGNYCVERHKYGDEVNDIPEGKWSPWRISYCFDEYYDEDEWEVSSLADGKRQAQTLWEDRILPMLEEAS